MNLKASVLALAFVLMSAPAAYSLRLSQIEFDLSLPPGTSETFSFVVTNNEAEETVVSVSLADWERALDGENRFLEPGSLPRSAARWLTVAPNRFNLAPDQSVEVRFTLTVPSGIEGTYWAALLVEGTPRQAQTPEGTVILVRKRFAVKVLETPPGTGTLAGRLVDLRLEGVNPLTTVIQFENAGTVNMPEVKGRVEIRDITGQTLESIPIEVFPALPGARRELRVVSARPRGDVLPPGRYLVLIILDFGGDSLLGGQLQLRIDPLALVPLEPGAGVPQDLDGDALFEDVNGDGQLSDQDAVVLGFHLDEAAVQDNARAFDFDNDGDVDFDDVTALKALVEAG